MFRQRGLLCLPQQHEANIKTLSKVLLWVNARWENKQYYSIDKLSLKLWDVLSPGSLGTNLSPHKLMRKKCKFRGNPLVSVLMCFPGLFWVCRDIYWMQFKERIYTENALFLINALFYKRQRCVEFTLWPCYFGRMRFWGRLIQISSKHQTKEAHFSLS